MGSSMNSKSTFLVLLVCYSVRVWAQQPTINPGGVVNAASLGTFPAFTSGQILSIFGQNLASTTALAVTVPLPYTLAGTSVTINGVPAPLFYVSPTQINLQAPSRLVSEGAAQPVGGFPVIVNAPSGSTSLVVNPISDAFGIFTQDASGCGTGAIQNVAPDGTVTLNSHSSSASPGSFISVYGTGLPAAYLPPPEGTPASNNPLSLTVVGGFARFGLVGFFQAYAQSQFSGLAPGLIGVNQMNLQLPDDAPEGCDVPFTIETLAGTSQPVTLSVRKGGGACQNDLGRFASLHWQKTTTLGPESTNPQVTESFTGTLVEGPKSLIAPPSSSSLPQSLAIGPVRTARSCAAPGVKSLSAGRLTLTGVNGVQIYSDSAPANPAPYAAILPSGSIQSGQVQISAAGGPDVGPFQSSLSIPAPIEITTPLPPGTALSTHQPIRVAWNKGSSASLVTLRVEILYPGSEQAYQTVTRLGEHRRSRNRSNQLSIWSRA